MTRTAHADIMVPCMPKSPNVMFARGKRIDANETGTTHVNVTVNDTIHATRPTWAPSRIWDALGWKLYESEGEILAGYWRGVGAINHPISAPKMKRASIFLNAASGFLKKYSPEAEKS